MEIFFLVAAVLVLYRVFLHSSGNLPFWKAVARHPEEAWVWFQIEKAWVIADSQPSSDYVGPFKIQGADGREARVYGHKSEMDASEKGFMTRLQAISSFEKRFVAQDEQIRRGENLLDIVKSDWKPEFFDWLANDPVVQAVAGGAKAEDFKELYGDLVEGMAGQFAGGRYVLVAILTNPSYLQEIIALPQSGRVRRASEITLEFRRHS